MGVVLPAVEDFAYRAGVAPKVKRLTLVEVSYRGRGLAQGQGNVNTCAGSDYVLPWPPPGAPGNTTTPPWEHAYLMPPREPNHVSSTHT